MTENHSLKNEFALRQASAKARELQEARELLESYVLIAEKLNTSTISRIVDAMNAVEDSLKPVLPKLRSLQKGLDDAERELTALISGAGGNDSRKTGRMMGKAMAFYQGLSEFLRDDLEWMLKSRMLAQAKANPEQPVGPKLIPAFKQALAVSKTGGFLKKMFSSTNIPYIDNGLLAQELATLSYNELLKLSQVGKTPAVISSQQLDQAAQAAMSDPSKISTAPVVAPTLPSAEIPSPVVPGAPAIDKGPQVKAAVAKALEPHMGRNIPADVLDAVTRAALRATR